MEFPEDSDIIKALHNSENLDSVFNIIIKKYQKQLYFHIRRMVIDHEDTNDLLQETFYKAYVNLKTFRSESAIYTWLYRIATNTTLNFIKQKQRYSIFSISRYNDILAQKIESDPYFDGDKLQKALHMAILMLPTKQQLVFNMKYFEDIKYETMAKILKTSVGALKASYHHAVNKIEKYISKY